MAGTAAAAREKRRKFLTAGGNFSHPISKSLSDNSCSMFIACIYYIIVITSSYVKRKILSETKIFELWQDMEKQKNLTQQNRFDYSEQKGKVSQLPALLSLRIKECR